MNEKKQKLNAAELETLVGGAAGEPVPGAEILIEQEPNDVPVQVASNKGGFAVSGRNNS